MSIRLILELITFSLIVPLIHVLFQPTIWVLQYQIMHLYYWTCRYHPINAALHAGDLTLYFWQKRNFAPTFQILLNNSFYLTGMTPLHTHCYGKL